MENYKRDIYKFIDEYFNEIDDLIQFNLNFFLKNKIETIDLDMLSLEKFIFQAFNFLKTNTGLYFSRFVNKLILDIKNLLEFLSQFQKQTKLTNTIFELKFLNNLPEYTSLKSKIEDSNKVLQSTSVNITSLETQIKFFNPETKEEQSELKQLRGRLVDAIHYNAKAKENISTYTYEINELKLSLKDIFVKEFTKSKNSYFSKLKLVINTKLYYLNKKIWLEANASKKTITYLKDLGISKINLNIYINNYLKHIDISRSVNYDNYAKIEDILKELNE